MSLHKHFVTDLYMYMYLSRSLKFCWFLPSRNFGFSVVEVCSTIRCLVLCPWGLLLQIKTKLGQSLQNQVNATLVVCALVGLWIKKLEFETFQAHCLVFSAKANYAGSLLQGQRLKKWVVSTDKGS